MKAPTEQEIIDEVQDLKDYLKNWDFQMGISYNTERKIYNSINKILRMLKVPVRRAEFKSWTGKLPKKRKVTQRSKK